VTYLPRIVDAELDARLGAAGAVVIEGPKASGKTETARQRAASSVLLDVDENARRAATVDPSLVLDGPTPRLIDEWQVEPGLWNHVRRAVDDRGVPGQFVLTGSSVPADDVARHTGAGRFSFLRMRPMTLFETGHTNDAVSLGALLAGDPPRSDDPGLTVADLADRITSGGWPAQHDRRAARAARAARDYLEQVRQVDVSRVAGSRRDPARIERLLRSLARNTATEVAITVLAADAGGGDGPLDRHTVAEYLNILDRLMVIEDQPPMAGGGRSRSSSALASSTKGPRRCSGFVTPSTLARAASPPFSASSPGQGSATSVPTASPSFRSARSLPDAPTALPRGHYWSSKRTSCPLRRLSSKSPGSNDSGSKGRPSHSSRSWCSGCAESARIATSSR
jgi:predicted AAA+ superfamily ATPase